MAEILLFFERKPIGLCLEKYNITAPRLKSIVCCSCKKSLKFDFL